RAKPARHHRAAGQASRPIPRLQRHSGDVHVPPRVPAAASTAGKKEGRVGGYEDAAGANGQGDPEAASPAGLAQACASCPASINSKSLSDSSGILIGRTITAT